MWCIAIKGIAFALGNTVFDTCCFHSLFCANWLKEIGQAIVAYLDFVHICRSPTWRTDPDFTFSIAVAVHQRRNIRTTQIGYVSDVICGRKILGHTKTLVSFVGVRGQGHCASFIDIFLCKAFLVWQPDIWVHVNVAFSLIHRLEYGRIVARHIFDRTADTGFNHFAQNMGNRLRTSPCWDADFHIFSKCRSTGRRKYCCTD